MLSAAVLFAACRHDGPQVCSYFSDEHKIATAEALGGPGGVQFE